MPIESRRLAAELLAHYPRAFITAAHITAIASDLEKEGLDIADDVIALLRLRCKDPPSSNDIRETAREVRKETMSGHEYNPFLCTYDDVFLCNRPSCQGGMMPNPHGHLMTNRSIRHGAFHLKNVMDGAIEERESARYPDSCSCGWMPDGVVPPLEETIGGFA